MTAPQRRRWFDLVWPLPIALLIGGNVWLFSGCLVPYLDGAVPDYVALMPSPWRLLAVCAGTTVLLALCARELRRRLAWTVTPAIVAPATLLALPLLSAALLATPLRRYAGPWLYVGIDLQWWLIAAVVVLVALEFDGASERRLLNRWIQDLDAASRSTRVRWALGLAMMTLLAACSLLTSPQVRFESVLVGDEPKYLRYDENWYRGRGMDITDLGPIAELPADFKPSLASNISRFGAAVSTVAGDLTDDARRRIGLSSAPSRTQARSDGGWFVEGRHGGVYQVHTPGISLLLLPGYVIDRALDSTTRWHPLFPTFLYATGGSVLLLYLVWGFAVFGLIWSYTRRAALSWALAATVMLSLPASAFAYQYYPEVAAGAILAVLTRYAIVDRDLRVAPAAAFGLLAGLLPWLHIRFLPLALGAAVVVFLTRRSEKGALVAFTAGLAVPLAVLGAYDYYVTGSLMPWSLYALSADATLFSTARAWQDLPAFWFDRTWGLVAHAPVFLFALPGFWVCWRRNRLAAVVVAAAILAVAIPAAGHGYTGAFTTPLRLVAAVVPLLALPLADAATAFARSRWYVAALAIAAVVSIQTGLTYNVHLVKSEAYLQSATIGGWMFPLLLPDFETPRLAQPLTWLWILVSVALLALPKLIERARANRQTQSWTVTIASVLLIFTAGTSALAAFTGLTFLPRLMLRPGDARDRLIQTTLVERPAIRWSSRNGAIDVQSYFPNPPETATWIELQPPHPNARDTVELIVQVRRPGNRPGWGTAAIDFGDGTTIAHIPVEGEARSRHVYRQPGDVVVRVDLDLFGLPRRTISQPLRIDAGVIR